MPRSNARLWQNLWVRLAVALAFADASIVVLALPQLLDRLHTSIGHVVWVIVAYNLALIAGSLALSLGAVAARVRSRIALVAGLAVFGLASIGCGAADSLAALIPLRVLQGFGGALVLCASLPLFAGAAREGDSPLFGWSAAAAIGAAIGPAAGGVLTDLFSWRSIFFFQAPVAAIAAVAVLAVHAEPGEVAEPDGDGAPERTGVALGPMLANLGLTLLSAGLIGALFLVVIELINGWLVSPLGAAAVVLTIPIATAAAERAVRGISPAVLGMAGALLLALGLFALSRVTHRRARVGRARARAVRGRAGARVPGAHRGRAAQPRVGDGPGSAHRGRPGCRPRTRAARARARVRQPARHGAEGGHPPGGRNGAHRSDPARHEDRAGAEARGGGEQRTAESSPDLSPVFREAIATAAPADRPQLVLLEHKLDAIIQRAVTAAFRRPFEYAALFALAVIPLLGAGLLAGRARARPLRN